jgi:mevalonate kinase
LGKLFDHNQMLLSGWFLSTNEIEEAIRLARSNGAFGAKLTGGGGGGCVIAVPSPGSSAAILAAWQRHGLTCFATRVA